MQHTFYTYGAFLRQSEPRSACGSLRHTSELGEHQWLESVSAGALRNFFVLIVVSCVINGEAMPVDRFFFGADSKSDRELGSPHAAAVAAGTK